MKKFVLAISSVTLMTVPALASDLPGQAAPAAPVTNPPAFTWTGFYVGGNIGYSWGTGRLTIPGVGSDSGSYDGVIGGGQIGYNWQTGDVVFGAEADLEATGISRSETAFGARAKSEIQYLGTVRGRVGMSFDNIMPYVTAGLAYANNKISGTVLGATFSDSKTHFGWTVGGGVEVDIGNGWSLKGEYLYVDLENKTYLQNVAGGFRARADFHTARIGVNYRF